MGKGLPRMPMRDYLKNALLDHQLGGPDCVRPATVYVALFKTPPTSSGGGTEVSGGSYARVPLTNDGTSFPPAVNGQKTNGVAIVFPYPTTNWGTVTHFALYNSPTGGGMLRYGQLVLSKVINVSDVVSFAPGELNMYEG